MAWYEVEYSCGHVERKQLYGKESERASWMAWAKENKVCSDCYNAKMRAEADESAKSIESRFDFADLSGSDKQVKWAESIRVQMVVNLEDARDKTMSQIAEKYPDHDMTEGLKKANAIIGKLASVDSASWFIDSRNLSVDAIMKKLAKM